jgi:hypothetical protein
MIHEFAVEPDSIDSWDNFRAIMGNMGIEYGRLISRFPRRWERMVYDSCSACQDVKLLTIVEKLNMKSKLVSMGREYDSTKTWLENAEGQHRKEPFRAIITKENPGNKKQLLVAETIYNGMGHPWDVPRERTIERTPEAIGNCASLLLGISKEVLLVDPYFNPERGQFRNTFANLMNCACQRTWPTRFELHVKYKEEDIGEWRRSCLSKLPSCIPKGFHIRVLKWRQRDGGEKFHARYILTERGGIRYDVGLDAGYEGETTDVSILDMNLYKKRWKDYQKETAAYDLVDEFEI